MLTGSLSGGRKVARRDFAPLDPCAQMFRARELATASMEHGLIIYASASFQLHTATVQLPSQIIVTVQTIHPCLAAALFLPIQACCSRRSCCHSISGSFRRAHLLDGYMWSYHRSFKRFFSDPNEGQGLEKVTKNVSDSISSKCRSISKQQLLAIIMSGINWKRT